MGDNSLDWASLLGGIPDSDELILLLMNDVKVEKPEDEQPQESSKFLVQPTTNKIIRNGGCLINPLGFPYRSRMQVLAADAPSGSGELLVMNDLPVYKRGRNNIQEAIEEAEQKKRKNKIKNRIAAAKSRARSQHTRFLEEKVEQLRNENAHLKKLLSLEAAAAERLPEEREVMQGKKAKQCLESEELHT
ncbi:hypothetical protein ES319_A05G085200v1 [Gossypium barbadense]|uniref:BZIP domain-containing protein n=1 Tax=Gossypium barbadense TaxID=3634 RepID=A0A5J5VMN1_GOSBA|nr:hypothetical protein ES319_A05G085200v1 [Gossypium barbadense]